MLKKRLIPIIVIVILMCSSLYADDILLASWNVRILSDKSRDDSELQMIAQIIDRYDLVAIQEVRDTRVLNRLRVMLPGWDYIASESVGRGVTELYAFFYRVSDVKPISDAKTIEDPYDVFIREPAVASFKAANFDFTLVSNHILYGDSKNDRRAEIRHLDDLINYIDEINNAENDVILLGDFNMPASDQSWEMEGFIPVIDPSWKTTITDTSSYDNIWLSDTDTYSSEFMGLYEIYHFDEILYDDDNTAKLEVSDHRPIAIRLSTDSDDDLEGSMPFEISYTPTGVAPVVLESTPDHIYVSEVVTAPTTSESVTLYNPTNTAIQLSGWTLGDKNNQRAYRFPKTTIFPTSHLIIPHSSLTFQINNRDEIIYLFDDSGNMVDIWED